MGIESDQLVLDYLSRVGDLAQQRQLDSGTRMRLVSSLRGEIDSRRARNDTPAAVRSILGSLGTPEKVVAAASTGAPPPERFASWARPADPPDHGHPEAEAAKAAEPGTPDVPEQRGPRMPKLRWRKSARPEEPAVAEEPADLWGPYPAGPGDGEVPDWWRVERGPFDGDGFGGGRFGGDGLVPGVPGFRGGVEIPAMLRPPPPEPDPEDGEEGEGEGKTPVVEVAAAGDGEAVVAVPFWRRRLGPAGVPAQGGSPVLLIAAVLLVAGVVMGSWIVLAAGWGLAYVSRRLSRTEAKFAVLGLPGAVAVATAVWLWGRAQGRWGDPLPTGETAMREALADTWPWSLRAAALVSALYLVWRARRV
ncbi:hypothetical protein [Streptomyces sp. NPDC046887]|uniref:hypothetical protein n=1 Tax=Streptomyces sp. NPDC046887 TaxID=3155472 RepID=UPI0033DF539E